MKNTTAPEPPKAYQPRFTVGQNVKVVGQCDNLILTIRKFEPNGFSNIPYYAVSRPVEGQFFDEASWIAATILDTVAFEA